MDLCVHLPLEIFLVLSLALNMPIIFINHLSYNCNVIFNSKGQSFVLFTQPMKAHSFHYIEPIVLPFSLIHSSQSTDSKRAGFIRVSSLWQNAADIFAKVIDSQYCTNQLIVSYLFGNQE